jgi:hypothetical protein
MKNLNNKTMLAKNIKHSIVTLGLLMNLVATAQTEGVSIKTTPGAPHASAMLDVESGNKGVLVPRLNLQATNIASPVSSPTTGLLVYNLATAGITPTNVTPGFYYWDGGTPGQWKAISSGPNLWSNIGTGSNIIPTNMNAKTVIGSVIAAYTPTFNLEVVSPAASNTFICKFEGKNGTQLRFGYNDLNGEIGGGAGCWLTQKTYTTTGPCFGTMRYVQLYEPGDWGFGVTSYGKCKGVTGNTYVDAIKNNLCISTTHSLYFKTSGATFMLNSNGLMQGSDSTLKKNITNETNALEKIKQIRPVTYSLKSDPTNQLAHGVIAQELATLYPELVSAITSPDRDNEGNLLTTNTTKLAVGYNGLITILIKALQEQQAIIENLKTRLHNLDGQ